MNQNILAPTMQSKEKVHGPKMKKIATIIQIYMSTKTEALAETLVKDSYQTLYP